MLNQDHLTQMATPLLLVNTSSDTLKRVLNILHLANNYYHYFNTSNAWNVPQGNRGHNSARHPHQTPLFFNCGEPHMPPDFNHPLDESNSARNSKAYMDKLPDGPTHNVGRKKWTKSGRGDCPDRSHGSGVQLMGNKWMCFCKRTECRWDLTHTSGFFEAWSKNKSKFSLPATH